MKKNVFFLTLFIALFLINQVYGKKAETIKNIEIDSIVTDSIEYELLVFDTGFDIYLLSQPPMNFYSEHYYKNWNIQYVNEWNNRHISRASSELYETYIHYNPFTEYGIELEYKLYYYFRYFEVKNNVRLVQRGK